MFKIMGKLSGRKKLTLKEIGDLWLQSKKLNVKESSYCNYKRNLEDHIYPVIRQSEKCMYRILSLNY